MLFETIPSRCTNRYIVMVILRSRARSIVSHGRPFGNLLVYAPLRALHRHALPRSFSSATSELGVRLHYLALGLRLGLLPCNPGLATLFLKLLATLAIFLLRLHDVHVAHPADCARDIASTDREHEVDLQTLGVWVVFQNTRTETGFDCRIGDHAPLL